MPKKYPWPTAGLQKYSERLKTFIHSRCTCFPSLDDDLFEVPEFMVIDPIKRRPSKFRLCFADDFPYTRFSKDYLEDSSNCCTCTSCSKYRHEKNTKPYPQFVLYREDLPAWTKKSEVQFRRDFLHQKFDIHPEEEVLSTTDKLFSNVADEGNYVNFFEFNKGTYRLFYDLELIGFENCRLTFEDTAFKGLLKSNRKFDLLIVDSFISLSLLYLSEYYNVPVIIYSSFDSSYNTNPLFGNPAPPSYVPNIFLKYSAEMSLFQRLVNSLVFLMNEAIFNFVSIPNHDKLVKEFFPDAPHLSEYLYKASVVLLNSDVSVMEAMPKTPGMIHIGGYHIRITGNLPEDLEKIMENSEHGVILFSLGSNIKSSQMPKDTVQAILEIFSKMKEKIIWKWEDEELPGKPSNVFIRKWLPQNDILAHNKTKLFITHGGQHSILETVYYGIPCVSIPVFMDQGANSYRASHLGYAETIPYEDFTPNKFEKSIKKVLNESRYTTTAKKRSRIMRDKLSSPEKKIVFWTEYVVRHKGAKHLKITAVKLNWYQYFLLDVVSFIIFFLLCCIIAVKRVLKFKNERKKKNE